jgi:hypothetical protein
VPPGAACRFEVQEYLFTIAFPTVPRLPSLMLTKKYYGIGHILPRFWPSVVLICATGSSVSFGGARISFRDFLSQEASITEIDSSTTTLLIRSHLVSFSGLWPSPVIQKAECIFEMEFLHPRSCILVELSGVVPRHFHVSVIIHCAF